MEQQEYWLKEVGCAYKHSILWNHLKYLTRGGLFIGLRAAHVYILCQDCSALATLCTFEGSDDPNILIGIMQGLGV